MRLLEPINGIKSIQGHYLVNMIFFIAIYTIDKDIETNLRDTEYYNLDNLHVFEDESAEIHGHSVVDDAHSTIKLSSYHQYISQFYTENAMNDEDFVVLNSHGHGDKTPEELAEEARQKALDAKPFELKLLKILQWLHLFGSLAIPFMMWLKSKECYLMK